MTSTERLYYTDSYRREFDARAVERSDDRCRVYLDATAFYPTSGGQPHDLGTIAGIPVVDVVDEGDRVAHVLADPLPDDRLAGPLHGVIDWARRFDHMQQHTGQHLLSAVFEDLFHYHTVSVHFGAASSTLDLDRESLDAGAVSRVERAANLMVAEDRPVTVDFEDAATATGLRKPPDRGGTLRVVSIRDLDKSACGGTHVAGTGEIGAILLRRVEHIRKTTRVEFVCGARAIARARADFEALSGAAATLSAAVDDVPGLVVSQAEQLRSAHQALRRAERELATVRLRALYDAATPTATGVRLVELRSVAATMDELRVLAQAALDLPGAVVAASLADPSSVLVAAAADSGIDAGRVLKDVLARVGGRGGGSPRLAQGSVPPERITELHARLAEALIGRAGAAPGE